MSACGSETKVGENRIGRVVIQGFVNIYSAGHITLNALLLDITEVSVGTAARVCGCRGRGGAGGGVTHACVCV